MTAIKKLMLVLLICSMSYGLNAPLLISATALSDSSVSLSWRNNDAATTGFIIQRKDSTETAYHFVDSVKSPTQLTYTDLKGLLLTTLYTYQVIAYDAIEISDTSNSLQVTTLALTQIFKAPKISISGWHGETSTFLQISITDSSNCEIGYRIYREQNFSSSFSVIADMISAIPKRRGDVITWTDNTVSFNTWYRYKVAAYKSNDSLFSTVSMVFTFHYIPQQPQNIVRFQKLSDFPISDSGGWSARAGDSIILKENPSPAGMFSVINVHNPVNPSFAGYIDSTAVRAYPLQTLMPVFVNYGVSNSYTYTEVLGYNDRMLIAKDSSIVRMYQVVSNNLSCIDSLQISNHPEKFNLLLLNDTLLGIQYMITYNNNDLFNFNCYSLSSSGFSTQFFGYNQNVYSYQTDMGGSWGRYYYRPYIHGFTDNNIFISVDYWNIGKLSQTYTLPKSNSCLVFNSSNSIRVAIPVNMPYANTYNTGIWLSQTENLCTGGFYIDTTPDYRNSPFYFLPGNTTTELFVASDIRDPRPYSTALANNAIYRDSVHKQNTLQNILLDTANKRVFLIFTNNMSILSYETPPAAPSAPLLLSPANGAADQPVSLSLIWNKISIATSYHIQIATDTGFTSMFAQDTSVTDTMKPISGLSNSTIYFWRARAKNTGGTSNWTSRWSFTTIIAAPVAPMLVQPANGDTNQPVTPMLRWSKVSGAATYRVQVSSSNSFSTLFMEDSLLTDTSKVIAVLADSTTYYWRVKAVNIGGESGWSNVWSFVTGNTGVLPQNPSAPRAFSITGSFTTVRYSLPKQCHVSLKYYDLRGRLTASLINSIQGPGDYMLSVKSALPSNGTYIRVFEAGSFVKRELVAMVGK